MRKTMMMTAALAGLAVASQAAVSAVSYDGTDAFDTGAYELLTGTADLNGYYQGLGTERGQTFTVTNGFDLGAITILYQNTSANVISNMAVRVFPVDDAHAIAYTIPEETLFTGTFDAPPTAGGDYTLYLSLGTSISLTPGAYMVQIDQTDASAATFKWKRSDSNAADYYPGGQEVKAGGTTTPLTPRDFSLGLGLLPVTTANDDLYVLAPMTTSTNVAAPGVLANDLAYDYPVLVTNISSGSLTFNVDGSFECSGLPDGTTTFSYALVSGMETSTPAMVYLVVEPDPTPIVAWDVLAIDFGGVPSITPNYNDAIYNTGVPSWDVANLVRLADGSPTLVTLNVAMVGDYDRNMGDYTAGNGGNTNDTSIYEDTIATWDGNPATPNDNSITLTFTGLDDSLTYDIVGGAATTEDYASSFTTDWTIGTTTNQSDCSVTNGYVTFTDMTSTGGVLVITITDALHRVCVSQLELTATAYVPPPQPVLTLDGDSLSWNSGDSYTYTVWVNDRLSDVNGWVTFTTVIGTAPTNTVTVPQDQSVEFYKVTTE